MAVKSRWIMWRLPFITIVLFLGLVVLTSSQTKQTPDPLSRVYATTPDKMFPLLGRLVAERWKVTHSDKDLCLVSFEVATTLTSSGFDVTATCEAAENETRVRVKARQKGSLSLKGKEQKFAKTLLDEISKRVDKQK